MDPLLFKKNVIGNNNTAIGYTALQNNTTSQLTAVGSGALQNNTTGFNNTAIGYSALNANITGSHNTAIGHLALNANSLSNQHTAIGSSALLSHTTTGASNTAIGYQALASILTGSNNIAIGDAAGTAYLGSESNNILTGNPGTVSELTTIRIGVQGTQTACYIAGINGSTVNATGIAVSVDSTGKLGTTVSSIRYKQDVHSIEDVSLPILDLQPVAFRYKHDPNHLQYGLIAEDVEKVLSEIVIYNDKCEPETIQYQILPIFLLNEIQRLRKRVLAYIAKN